MLKEILAFTGLTKRQPPPILPAPAMPGAPKARRQVRIASPDNGATLAPGKVVDEETLRMMKDNLRGVHRREEPWPVSTAVRWLAYEVLPHKAKSAISTDAFSTRADPRASARAALGPERVSYLRMRLLLRQTMPTLSRTLEGVEPHETAFTRRLDIEVIEDIKTWRAGLAIYDAQVAASEIDLTPPPEPVTIPADVERAIATQVAAELARLNRGARGQGGGASVSGGQTTTEDVKTEPPEDETPPPPAGPKVK